MLKATLKTVIAVCLALVLLGCDDEECKVYDPEKMPFGACEMLIGWVWDGEACVTIGGCERPDDAEDLFKNKEACETACDG